METCNDGVLAWNSKKIAISGIGRGLKCTCVYEMVRINLIGQYDNTLLCCLFSDVKICKFIAFSLKKRTFHML